MGAGRAERFLVALTPSTDLLLRAKYLLIAAMVDGGALRADGLIADEANRLDATKAGIAVGQEQRQSIYAVLLAQAQASEQRHRGEGLTER